MSFRQCWQNCFAPDAAEDPEITAINAMEDALAPLYDVAVQIRWLITRFEVCYHQADKEAEMIIRAIGSGRLPEESNERPPERKQELQNAHDILTAWCEENIQTVQELKVRSVPADELLACLGEKTDLKLWQVQRIIEKLKDALDRSGTYQSMELDVDGYGKPLEIKAEEYYKDHLDFLKQTTSAMIHYKLDGEDSQMSLALAIDLFRPCNWNYVGNLMILLKAINGDLHPKEIFAPCSLNGQLTLLYGRLVTIANTLRAFWTDSKVADAIDEDLFQSLGLITSQKQWLASSFDKTIRLQLNL